MTLRNKLSALALISIFPLISFAQEASKASEAYPEAVNREEETVFTESVLQEAETEKLSVNENPFPLFFTTDYDLILQAGLQASHYSGHHLFTLSPDITAALSFDQFKFLAGLQYTSGEIEFTLQSVYAPSWFEKWDAGIKLIYHEDYHFGEFNETDLLAGFYSSNQLTEKLNLEVSALYFLKVAQIYSIKDTTPYLINHMPGFELVLTYMPLGWLTEKLIFSSYTFYNYPTFLAPNLTLDSCFAITEHFSTGFSLNVEYLDFFTLSAYFKSFNFRFYSSWRF